MSFSGNLRALTIEGPVLCVGIDPHPDTLIHWGFSDTPEGLAGWVSLIAQKVRDAQIPIVKPQAAFFERHGVSGMRSLSHFVGEMRAHDILTVGDAKRGDIGSTMAGYAQAWLRPGADFEVDALTLAPYQGVGALVPAFEQAQAADKGVFVLASTSNPEAWATQSAKRTEGTTVAGGVIADLARWVNTYAPGDDGAFGVVVGATVDQEALGVDLTGCPRMPILAPGYGAQGAVLADAKRHFPSSVSVLAVAARSIVGQSPDGFEDRYTVQARELRGV
jgi:orotidine-5'-phosphate decarboxylase